MASEDRRSSRRQLATVVFIGTTVFACVAVGMAGGYFLDRWLGTLPWLTLTGLGLGIAAAGREFYRAIRMLDRWSEPDDDR